MLTRRLPPYGRELAERLRFRNPPLFATVCVGLDSWTRAKEWATCPNDVVAMVLPPDSSPTCFMWPVHGIPVVVEAEAGPTFDVLKALGLELLKADPAGVVLVSPSRAFPFTRFRWQQ